MHARLRRSLRVTQGDTVPLRVACAPSEADPRDMDLVVGVELEGAAASAQYHVLHTLAPSPLRAL